MHTKRALLLMQTREHNRTHAVGTVPVVAVVQADMVDDNATGTAEMHTALLTEVPKYPRLCPSQ